MRYLLYTLLCFAAALPADAGLVLRCDHIRVLYKPERTQWSLAYDASQPISPVEIVLWLVAIILSVIIAQRVARFIRVIRQRHAVPIAQRRSSWIARYLTKERVSLWFTTAATFVVRLICYASWATLAIVIVWLLIQQGQSSGFFDTIQDQCNVWLSAVPTGWMQFLIIAFAFAGIILVWVASSRCVDYGWRKRLTLLGIAACSVGIAGVLSTYLPVTAQSVSENQIAEEVAKGWRPMPEGAEGIRIRSNPHYLSTRTLVEIR